ncbi:MAG: tRNA lysidine(34) synthetase TilS [Spirochaetaceae bacterium]|jgi:tRNA(Ile)-lysidine synthase|nr:tRNA lysidine(34) synthetase TilS [Spirochaetaceae bacterium]
MGTQLSLFEQELASGLGDWPAGTRFLAAVSGGADSTAMLAALAALAQDRGLVLRCFHVEHGIRPAEESLGDAEWVQELCRKLGVPCKAAHIPPGKVAGTAAEQGIGLEAAARFYRHALWNREARRIGAARVLVAHTRDDALETALMRVLRGSGPAGLAAMKRDNGRVLRPLLALDRSRVLEYLAAQGIPFRTDSTNADPSFLRNRIRLLLVPHLDSLFPGWRAGLLGLAETQRRAASFLGSFAESAVPWEKDGGRRLSLSVPESVFFSAPGIIREEAVFLAAGRVLAGKQGRAGPARLRRETVRRFCAGQGKSADLGKVRARAGGGSVQISARGEDGAERGFALLINKPGVYRISGIAVEIRAEGGISTQTEGAVYVTLPLVLRPAFPDESKGRAGSCFTALLAAEDTLGQAALIGRKGAGAEILERRPLSAVQGFTGDRLAMRINRSFDEKR